MKKLWTLMAMAVVFAGCSKDEADSPLNTYTLTGYTDVESRTAFDTPVGNKIPFQWSAGDFIYNGTNKSYVLSNGGSSATFTFSGTSSSSEIYYNVSGSSAKQANVKPTQIVGNLGTNGDFGYGTVNNGSFTLNHATSYVWFDTTLPNGATLETITLDAGITTIAGTATWNEGQFGTISNAGSSITLQVNKSSVGGAELAMVIFPTTITDASVTYQLKINNKTKYYKKTISGTQQVPAGKTWKITTNLSNVELYEMRVLTFEDADAKFTPYVLDYAGVTINNWSNLIDDVQYGGALTYNNYGSATYYWCDENNTEIEHSFTTPYWGGGHAISNFVIENYETLPSGYYGWYELQFATPIGGHNNSSNFCVHNGYADFYNTQIYDGKLAWFSFKDGKERVVDHMYVTNTCYVLNSLTYGDGFNSPATDDTYFKIIAYGYDANENQTGTSEFYLCNTGRKFVTNWQKWDLSSLGKVNKIVFNLSGSDDLSGAYGLNCPAYFAYDDVAVQFE